MDMSEDCWEHVGLLQEVSAAEPPPPPPAPDFLIQQQEVSQSISFFLARTILTTLVVGLFDRLGPRSKGKKAREIGIDLLQFLSLASNRKRELACLNIDRDLHANDVMIHASDLLHTLHVSASLSCNTRPFIFFLPKVQPDESHVI